MNVKGEKRVNFIRLQIYFTKKHKIEKLKDGFRKSKEKSVSDYLRKLIMLGYQTKRKDEMESLKQDLSLVKQCVFAMYKSLEKKKSK